MAVEIILSVVTVLPIGDVVFPFPVQPATWRLRASMGASVILASSRCSSSFSLTASRALSASSTASRYFSTRLRALPKYLTVFAQ